MPVIPIDDPGAEDDPGSGRAQQLHRPLGDDTLHIELPFPTIVRGTDSSGARFELIGVLNRLSAGALSLRLARAVDVGGDLSVIIQLSISPEVPGPRVALRGVVQHVEPGADGSWGIALTFTRHRFLYTAPA